MGVMRANLRSLTMLQGRVNLTGPLCASLGRRNPPRPWARRSIVWRSRPSSGASGDRSSLPAKEGLSEEQQARLRTALVRWLGSDEAALFAAFENRRAEVPFTVAIGGFFLEGEIDGLADNGDGAAFLIDYKTGGRADETPEQLDEKHRLQASCYAYALMRAGYESVDAHFLRIEHAAADNPRDPQIVPYHFEKTDLPALEALIIAKQHEAVV